MAGSDDDPLHDADLAEELMLGMENGVTCLWFRTWVGMYWIVAGVLILTQIFEKSPSVYLNISSFILGFWGWVPKPFGPQADTALRVMRLATVANNKLKRKGALDSQHIDPLFLHGFTGFYRKRLNDERNDEGKRLTFQCNAPQLRYYRQTAESNGEVWEV